MKNQYLITLFLATLMALTVSSCKKDPVSPDPEIPEAATVILNAEIQKPFNGYDKDTFCWLNGDEVYINNAVYPIMDASGTSARIENVDSAKSYTAVFPASIVPAGTQIIPRGYFLVTLPSTQVYHTVDGIQRVDMPMGAYLTKGNKLLFHVLCSIIRITINNHLTNGLSLESIALSAKEGYLSGTGTAYIPGYEDDDIFFPYESPRGSHSVALSFPDPVTIEPSSSAAFDIVVPGFSYDNITIKVNTTGGHFFESFQNIEFHSFHDIATATLNVTELLENHAELVDGYTFHNAIPSTATAVVFEYNSSVSSGRLLSTPNSPHPIYGNLIGTEWHVTTCDNLIYANHDCHSMFMEKEQLTSIDFGRGFNTSRVTSMEMMFYNSSNLTSLDVSNFNTSNVTVMRGMFDGCSRLTNLDVSNFNTSNVTSMQNMFLNCSSLTSLDVSNFNTSRVWNMSGMFGACSRLTYLDVSNFNTSNVVDMMGMFGACIRLTNLDVSNFNTSNVEGMQGMFSSCRGLSSLDVSNFNTSNVRYMSSMFSNCSQLTSLDVSNFNTSKVLWMDQMFCRCSGLTDLDVSSFNTSHVVKMEYMFYECSSLTSLDLSNFNTSNVIEMEGMFDGCIGLTSLDVSSFNTSRVNNMNTMFYNCSSLTSLDVSNFTATSARSMYAMFCGCTNLTSLDLSNFNATANTMQAMFRDCRSLTYLNLSQFNMRYLTDHRYGFDGVVHLGKYDMCLNLAINSQSCTIVCPQSIQLELEYGTGLPTSGVTFTWLRPPSSPTSTRGSKPSNSNPKVLKSK